MLILSTVLIFAYVPLKINRTPCSLDTSTECVSYGRLWCSDGHLCGRQIPYFYKI
jgi:hypothetical protein